MCKVEQKEKDSVGREISLCCNTSGENDKSKLEGTGQVEQNTQHWASDVKMQAEPSTSRVGGWEGGYIMRHNRK